MKRSVKLMLLLLAALVAALCEGCAMSASARRDHGVTKLIVVKANLPPLHAPGRVHGKGGEVLRSAPPYFVELRAPGSVGRAVRWYFHGGVPGAWSRLRAGSKIRARYRAGSVDGIGFVEYEPLLGSHSAKPTRH